MRELNFLQLANKIFQEENKPLSPEEIWRIAIAKGYDKLIGTSGKTPWKTLSSQMYVAVKEKPHGDLYKIDDSQPKRFFLRSLITDDTQQQIIEEAHNPEPKIKTFPSFEEKQLHPFMAYYGYRYLRAYLKTIDHTKSSKKDYGKWVHPDMVGASFPFGEWEKEVIDFSTITGNISVRLYSIELKRELNFNNLRESFFQAVSNSSWAHEGYLAAADISSDEGFMSELRRLSASFGIGIIKIDIEDPDATSILYAAKQRETLDWETVNKLCNMNPEFSELLERVKDDITTKKVIKSLYDPIMKKEDLKKVLSI